MIKYGISEDYLPDWDYAEALREIYQNFDDYGDYQEEVRDANYDSVIVTLSNDYRPYNFEFLSVGYSAKRGDSSTVGEHGEGLKMALLVLARNGLETSLKIRMNSSTVELKPTFYDDSYLGKCFGLDDHVANGHINGSFMLEFEIPRDDYDLFKGVQIDEEEILHSHWMGDVIDKPAGSVYVGGIFITQLPNMSYAYNFKPEHVSLDRDRKVPRSYDVEYAASKIIEGWDKLSIEDLGRRDATYITTIPKVMRDKFIPEIINKEVVFIADGIKAPSSAYENLKVFHRKKIKKLKLDSNKTRKPENLLKNFYEKYNYRFNQDQKIDFEVMLQESKKWVRKV